MSRDTKAADIRQIQILDMNGKLDYLPEKIDYKRAFWLLLSLLERIGEPQTTGEEVATRVAAYQYDLSEAGFSKQEMVEKALRLYQLVPKIGSRLVQNIQSEDERRIVEHYKAQVPLRLYDFKTKEYYDDKEAVEVFTKRLEEGYDGKILSAYPNGTVGPWKEDPRFEFYGWLDDRLHHGLANTVGQFLGFSSENIQKHLNCTSETHSFPEFLEMSGVKVDRKNRKIIGYEERNSIDYFLTKNWPMYDKIKFIYGYVMHQEEEWRERMGGLKIVFTLLDEPIAYANPVHNFAHKGLAGKSLEYSEFQIK
ncbi:MAG: hypothetical protein QXU11_11755 [Thermoproteota archaeon]